MPDYKLRSDEFMRSGFLKIESPQAVNYKKKSTRKGHFVQNKYVGTPDLRIMYHFINVKIQQIDKS